MSPIFVMLGLSLALCGVLCESRSLESDSNSASASVDNEVLGGMELVNNVQWPSRDVKVGQIGGVAFEADGNAVVFHRASRSWGNEDFEANGVYTKASEGKIQENTFVVIDKKGKQVDSWGADLFFMPHGLTIDSENNFWVTDVAAHQVFKFAPGNKQQPALTLGEALKPGSDAGHFCQPTDVAVASNGDFFVADGYCNSRIVKFDRNGKLLAQFGKASDSESDAEAGELSVPHSLALLEDEDALCVADRENERIQCFDAGLQNATRTGGLKGIIAYREFDRVFAIAYDKTDLMLHGLSVSDRNSFGFSINPELQIAATWSPRRGFTAPHDLAVSPDGKNILVGQLGGKRLQMFNKVY